jgi:hypothetical protein
VAPHKFRQLTSVSKSCAAAMQRNSKIGVLQKRFSTLRIFLVRRERDWNLTSKLAVAAEIRRLREQIELQNTVRCRIAMLSFNINALSDEECLVKYRFTKNYIGFISKLIPWDSCLDHRVIRPGHSPSRNLTTKQWHDTCHLEDAHVGHLDPAVRGAVLHCKYAL